ncbi:hypothetical protein PRN20_00265 [Devosia sp. ZB163]|uniref:hypothetical protein n=1 Tax=Devosia sp. ZB163 TaxID=3025938 RepID=UPI0023617C55|nr:hypothetical protein [Devosia sp. ZB163]MDC9822150.1 hypothetical protein [Devosia sp. ZB163]
MELVSSDNARFAEEVRRAVEGDFGAKRTRWADSSASEIVVDDTYRIVCVDHEQYFGHFVQLRTENQNLVEFNLGKGRRSSVGVECGKHYLLRSPEQLAIGPRPTFAVVQAGAREWYVVGEIGEGLGVRMMEFYLAAEPTASSDDVSWEGAGDHGRSANGYRSGCIVLPKHHPVSLRAQEWLKSEGFEPVSRTGWRPDYYVERDGKTYVVEVKPEASLQSAALAIGQLAIYADRLKADGRIAIFPEEVRGGPFANLAAIDAAIMVVYV